MPVVNLQSIIKNSGFSHAALIGVEQLDDGFFTKKNRPLSGTFLVFAASGPQFWRQKVDIDAQHPIDQAAIRAAESVGTQISDNFLVYYPHFDCLLNLQKLLLFCGWASDAGPLGICMHSEFGSYIAMRAVLYSPGKFTETRYGLGSADSPCIECSAPCVDTCPGQALDLKSTPDLGACSQYRRRKQSHCADRCVARLACPAGRQFQYDLPQTQHHYTASTWYL